MPTPKSVVKIKKNGVEYESNVDAVKYYTFELTRAALRDVGKYVKTVWRNSFDAEFAKHSGKGRKATSAVVYSNKDTLYPRVEVGLKVNTKAGWWAYLQEFGSITMPRRGLLTHAVEDNIAEIIKIESQYLDALNDDESTIEGLIDESEYVEEGD